MVKTGLGIVQSFSISPSVRRGCRPLNHRPPEARVLGRPSLIVPNRLPKSRRSSQQLYYTLPLQIELRPYKKWWGSQNLFLSKNTSVYIPVNYQQKETISNQMAHIMATWYNYTKPPKAPLWSNKLFQMSSYKIITPLPRPFGIPQNIPYAITEGLKNEKLVGKPRNQVCNHNCPVYISI